MREIEYTINVMCLSHPETISHLSIHGKVVFHEAVPWDLEGWGSQIWRIRLLQVRPWHSGWVGENQEACQTGPLLGINSQSFESKLILTVSRVSYVKI